jgi:hypothetical protein
MELDGQYYEFTKYNIKWISLLHQVKDIDSYKEASCKTSSIALTRSCGYLYCDGPTNGSLQSKNKLYQSKDKLFE